MVSNNELADYLPTGAVAGATDDILLDHSLAKTLSYRWLVFAVLAGGYILV